MPPTDRSLARQVDAARDRFEAAWRAGHHPRIEDHLGRTAGAVRAALLQALVAVEVRLRRATGETVVPRSYRDRFPDDADAVTAVFADPARAAGETLVPPESVRTDPHEARPAANPLAPDPTIPDRIGRFTVTGVLGAGAFGRVYRAKDPQLGRDVAIKMPLRSALESTTDRERFLREARAAAQLHHPNICPVHEVGEEDGNPFIVMGFVPGQSLAAVLKSRKEPLPPKQAALIARKLALALDAAHKKGVVHRDLKPANVMFDKERRDVVVTDFGLARAPRLGDAQTTRDGVLMGTPAYMSPEQARGDTKAVGPASDQYALGVMLYEMLTGRRPFSGTITEVLVKILHDEPDPPTAVRPELDRGLAAVVQKVMAKDPAARYASMRQLADALVPFASVPTARPATASTQTAHETTETQRIADVFAFTEEAVEKAVRRHRTPTWLKVGLALLPVLGLVALGSIVFFTRSDKVKVTIELTDVDLSDKTLTFLLDDEPVSAEALVKPVELKPGEHVLSVKRGKDVVKRVLLTVTGGRNPGIKVKDITPPGPTAAPPPPPPIPTPKGGPDGWTRLFNGKDLTGWKAVGGPKWTWADGRVVGAPDPEGTPGYLLTEAEYEDFELELEYRLGPAGGSGLFLRCVPTGQTSGAGQIELQLIDDGAYPKMTEVQRTGSIYGVFQRKAIPLTRLGEWNTVRVRLVKRHIEVWINGTQTIDTDLDTAGPKLATVPGLTRKAGGIGLQQNQKSDVEFRNARIRNLSARVSEAGFVPLFNGVDLTGWKTHPDQPGGWTVEDGLLTGRSTSANHLFSAAGDFDDFHLRAECRTNRFGNGGIYFRTPFAINRPNAGAKFPTGYEAQIIHEFPQPGYALTGSLLARPTLSRPAAGCDIKPDEWFTLEVIAQGRRLAVNVNGKETANVEDAKFDRGHLALQAMSDAATQVNTRVQFRKIEVKRLKAAEPGFVPLFDGKGLAGWDGLSGAWKWDGGLLLGTLPPGHNQNTFLASQAAYRDFELKFRVKLHTPTGNSGVQVRSQVVDPRACVVAGPQVEIDGGKGFGGLYGERTGGWMKQAPVETVRRAFKPGEFNDYFVRVVGKHVTIVVNGETLVDDDFPTMADEGVIAFQLHAGSRSDMTFRDVSIRELGPKR